MKLDHKKEFQQLANSFVIHNTGNTRVILVHMKSLSTRTIAI